MGMKANSGMFCNTSGSINTNTSKEMKYKLNIQMFAKPYNSNGRVSFTSISNNREYYYGKSAQRIAADMNSFGYETTIRKSKHSTSKAKVIIVSNSTKQRNITQVQVSPGSARHGNVPYVKISTNSGKYKVINSNRKNYKSDGKETARLIFRRRKKNGK